MTLGIYSLTYFLTGVELSLLVFYIKCNGISIVYVAALMCRRTDEVVHVPTVGLLGNPNEDTGGLNR